MPSSHSHFVQSLLWRFAKLSLLRTNHPVLRFLNVSPLTGFGYALHRAFGD
ncbi:MAG: hypothetical protein J6386_05475 [Candidatus Synoicihabitans palmerolidicus]|nr:hypothetical protein [Candidatus Synoicihabitans palmerolidicus]